MLGIFCWESCCSCSTFLASFDLICRAASTDCLQTDTHASGVIFRCHIFSSNTTWLHQDYIDKWKAKSEIPNVV
ncbi:hypothetical protein ILYODFUR_019658 [Ilyodon furcidens]|uniref:Secreted protein n=1 Tax=Ilyodon furcidens TaxID=33524 RepID=A0ABV0V7B3_9TELE